MKTRLRAPGALVGLGGALVVAISGCGGQGTGGDSPDSQKAVASKPSLVLGLPSDLNSWDPTKALPGPPQWSWQAVFDTLLNCDAAGKISPSAASSYDFTDGNKKLTLELRPGMKFSDGTAVDAAAAKRSLDAQAKSPAGKTLMAGVRVRTTGPMSVEVTSDTPNPSLPSALCSNLGAVASPAYLKSKKREDNPVGSGPYTYEAAASTPGSTYVLKKNPSYWNKKSFPYEKITLKVLASPTATVNALKTKQIDGAVTDLSSQNAVKGAGLKQVVQQGQWGGLLLEDHTGKKVPALGNVDVRRAINMVFDKKAVAEKLYAGNAEVTHQIFRKGSAAHIPDLADPYPYDVDKAKELMEKAGYGNGFSVEIPYIAGQGLESVLPVVIQNLKQLNIRAKQVTLSGSNAIANLISDRFPIIYWPLGNHGDSFLDIQTVVAPTGVWNTQKIKDPKADDFLQKIASASAEEQPELQQALNKYLIEQAWFAPLVYVGSNFSFDSSKVQISESSDPNQLAPNLRDFK